MQAGVASQSHKSPSGGVGDVSERPVDLVHLARYTLGDRALEREVLQLFATQSRLYLERLREASTQEAWRAAAHIIKGSARGIGAWHVAACAEAAEALPDAAFYSGRAAIVAALEDHVGAVNAYIRSLLADA